MQTITLKNGRTYEPYSMNSDGTQVFQGMSRKTLHVQLNAKDITLEEAFALYRDKEALSEMTLVYPETQQIFNKETGELENQIVQKTNIILNFTMPLSFSSFDVDDETFFDIKVAQKSDFEIAQEKLAKDNTDTQLALIEIASMIGG